MPLATDYDPSTQRASVLAPHFSDYRVFRFRVPSPSEAASRLADGAAGFAHDIYGGIKDFAQGMVSGISDW